MDNGKKIALFCSSSGTISEKFNEAARDAVREICARGFTVVSGGTVKGTMGVVGDEVSNCGGRHIGILPHFMSYCQYPELDTTVWTGTMAERKEKMREGTCAVIALPGGIGTLDEVIEVLVLAKLGKYSGKVIALNVDGFYDPLKSLLDHYVNTGMMAPQDRDLMLFPHNVDELVLILDKLEV